MKSKGFTLIELLAVIVILAIIALIATPIVLNIIKGSKESATIRGAEYYLDAVELAVARARLDNIKVEDGTYDILDTGNICLEGEVSSCTEQLQVDVKGEIPDSGTVTITNGKIVDINLTYDGETVIKDENELAFLPKPVSFEADDWSTIIANVKAGKTDKYIVGAEKEITLTSTDDDSGNADGFTTGTYTVRLANKTANDSVCSTENYSQTACGFVIEFVDIITTHNMNPAGEYNGTQYNYGWSVDGWPASAMSEYVNGTIYNAIEDVVRNAIIDTRVVSGYEKNKTENYTSTDKLYLLSTKEIYGTADDYDTVGAETCQLDYYKDVAKVTSSSYSGAKKYLNGTAKSWWLRSAYSLDASTTFHYVTTGGYSDHHVASITYWVAPAFRLG